MAQIVSDQTTSIDEQLEKLHDDMLDLFLRARIEQSGQTAPLIGAGLSALDGRIIKPHYISWAFNVRGKWNNPRLPLEQQKALKDVVERLKGFFTCRRTLLEVVESQEGKCYEAKLYSELNFSLPPRMQLRAYPVQLVSDQRLRLVVTYIPKT